MKDIVGDFDTILIVLSFFVGWMPPGNCDKIHAHMPAAHHQYPAQIVEPLACRALPKIGIEQRRER